MDKKIIIIGAGAAGFATASKLMSHGFQNIVVLEAENRFGGRINTIPFGANVVDMGAQWCHGEVGNVVYELAKDKNVLSSDVPRYDHFNFVRSNGEIIPEEISRKLVALSSDILNRNDKRMEKCEYNGSLGNYFASRYFDALRRLQYGTIDFSLQHETFDWFHQYRNMYVACDSWFNASCENYLQYIDCPGDLLLNWKDKGYCNVFNLLQNKTSADNANHIDVESKIQFNKEVTKIVYNTEGSVESPIKIVCSDETIYECDHLVCTVSLGVLKRHHMNMFEPLLSDMKIDCIESMAFGTVGKIFVEFTKPFWEKDWEGLSFLWRPKQLKQIQEEYSANSYWMKHIIGFYTVSHQPNILCGWISGSAAKKMEIASEEDFEAGVKRVLKMFLSPQIEFQVKNIIRSKWNANHHFHGSYTYYSLKSDAYRASTSKLARPILNNHSKPVIQFAGEATSTHYYSTVHGAVQSGWREAQRLIDFYETK